MVKGTHFCNVQQMPRNHAWRKFFFLLIFIFFCHGEPIVAASEERPEQKDTLTGLKDLFVYVDIGLSLKGPTQEALQVMVEKKLEESGLRIHPHDEDTESTTLPRLHIDIAIIDQLNRDSFFVNARIFQVVTLQQESGEIHPYAATWSLSTFGIGGIDEIRRIVEDVCEILLMDYHKVN